MSILMPRLGNVKLVPTHMNTMMSLQVNVKNAQLKICSLMEIRESVRSVHTITNILILLLMHVLIAQIAMNTLATIQMAVSNVQAMNSLTTIPPQVNVWHANTRTNTMMPLPTNVYSAPISQLTITLPNHNV